MAELKTKKNEASVEGFLNSITDEQRRADCFAVAELMKKVTKAAPKMWGTSIVGFGEYHYKYASGHEGDSCLVGFASRKEALVLYLMMGRDETFNELLSQLGKYKSGKGCLYIKKLADVDLKVLQALIKCSLTNTKDLAKIK